MNYKCNRHKFHTPKLILLFVSVMLLAGCASEPTKNDTKQEKFKINDSYLASANGDTSSSDSVQQKPASQTSQVYDSLTSLPTSERVPPQQTNLASQFSTERMVSAAAKKIPLEDFIHYSFGEVLGVNYLIDKNLVSSEQTVTLNVAESISERNFFEVIARLLDSNKVDILYENDVYFLHEKSTENNKSMVFGIGASTSSVPMTNDEIIQVVPLKYGIKISVERTLNQLVDAKFTADFEQSALFIRGKRENILRALDIVRLLDAPANRGKYVGLLHLTFIGIDDFSEQVSQLLENEGVPISIGKHNNKNVVIVPLPQIDSLVIFSSHQQGLSRVRYWAKLLDKPSLSETKQYFIYHPRYARASDIGESLAPLVAARSGGSSSGTSSRSAGSNNNNNETTGQVPSTKSKVGAQTDILTFVVDERSNAIVFYTTGKEYQTLIPLIGRLDVLPKQVLLDIIIAEVTLTDEFSLGVEFAIKNGDIGLPGGIPTAGALFGSSKTGGTLSIGGADGGIVATALQTNQYVNVLSNPSLLVRDGVTATMSVGTEISVVGSTVSDDTGSGDKSVTNVEYRKTGVEISVTPTVNAQGIVIMEIEEKISNQVKGSSGAGDNPSIFERAIKTEVVAESGQTIILAGLVSSDVSTNDDGVPFLKDIPWLGSLFKTESRSNTKTELVMLVTPKVIHRTDQWQQISQSFERGLSNISLPKSK